MCRSLAGVHSRAITETLAICGRGIASRPRGKSAVQSASSRTARHSVHPNHTSPERPRALDADAIEGTVAAGSAAGSGRE
jgi:hypothetical protein